MSLYNNTFNKIVTRFAEDLSKIEYQEKVDEINKLLQLFQEKQLPLRLDYARRDWEYAHIILAIERSFPSPEGIRILDFGGGNSPLCYYLAIRGFTVNVLDVDRQVTQTICKNSLSLNIDKLLKATSYCGEIWPLEDNAFECVLSVSVYEGLLRRQRQPFWYQVRRVLRQNGLLFMTFDYGKDARYVGDPPSTIEEIDTWIVKSSGMELVGYPPIEPNYDSRLGAPVKLIVDLPDGYDYRVAEYSFAAIQLRNSLKIEKEELSIYRQSRLLNRSFSISNIEDLFHDIFPLKFVNRINASKDLEELKAILEIRFKDLRNIKQVLQLSLDVPNSKFLIEYNSSPDTSISGSIEDILKLFLREGELWDLVYGGTLRIRGDVSLAMRVISCF